MIMQEPKVPNIEQFWSIEAVGTEATTFPDLTFLQQYQQTSISQTSEGIYITSSHGRLTNLTSLLILPLAREELLPY